MRPTTLLLRSLTFLLPLSFAASPAAGALPEPNRAVPLELRVPAPPSPVRGGGKTLLVYELYVTNLDAKGREQEIKALDVLAEGRDAPLLHLAGPELGAALLRYDGSAGGAAAAKLGGGQRAVAFLWMALDGPAPARRRHRVTVHLGAGDWSLEGGGTEVRTEGPLAIGPPLQSGRWLAANAPSNASIHRRTILTIDGLPRLAQRFAIDWIGLGEDGRPFHGDPKKNASWVGYGREILAAADGSVTEIKDRIPENVPLSEERA